MRLTHEQQEQAWQEHLERELQRRCRRVSNVCPRCGATDCVVLTESPGLTATTVNTAIAGTLIAGPIGGLIGALSGNSWQKKVRCAGCETTYIRGE